MYSHAPGISGRFSLFRDSFIYIGEVWFGMSIAHRGIRKLSVSTEVS